MAAPVVRLVTPDDTRVFLDVQRRSVRGLAGEYYGRDVIDAWAAPVNEDEVREFERNTDGELRLIAEIDGAAVGIGALVAADGELRACYVVPEAARTGVGSAIVREIERIAKSLQVTQLILQASTNAERFYDTLGYRVIGRGEHVLPNGQRMAAVRMSKDL